MINISDYDSAKDSEIVEEKEFAAEAFKSEPKNSDEDSSATLLEKRATEFKRFLERAKEQYKQPARYLEPNLFLPYLELLDDLYRAKDYSTTLPKDDPEASVDAVLKGIEQVFSRFDEIIIESLTEIERRKKDLRNLLNPLDIKQSLQFIEDLLKEPTSELEKEKSAAVNSNFEEKLLEPAKAEISPEKENQTPLSNENLEKSRNEKILRLMAEFENFKKRLENYKIQQMILEKQKLALKVQNIIEKKKQILNEIREWMGDFTFQEVQKVIKKLIQMLLSEILEIFKNMGLKELDPLGEAFDPKLHEALTMLENQTCEPGKVCKVIKRGYFFDEQLIRPAQVAVSKETRK